MQSMTLRGNVVIQTPNQANDSQIFAIYNDEASGSPVSFSVTALYNTVVGAGGHAAFLHVSNADGTKMSATVSNNIIAGTSQPVLVEDATNATVSGTNNWLQTGADATYLTGSILGASPGFSNAGSDDFTLAAGSACIGAADKSVPGQPTDEYYENEMVTREYRVRSSALDLGAFEHDTMGPGMGPYGAGGGGGSRTSTSTSTSTGTSTSSGGGGMGATGGSSSSGAGGSKGSSNASGGCHCEVAGGDGSSTAPWLLGIASWLAWRRRRRS
jgi:MYXO-CTERM domain-containing protein